MSRNTSQRNSPGSSCSQRFACLLIVAVLLLGASLSRAATTDSPALPEIALEQALAGWILHDGWRFHIGDDPAWADPAFDDGQWQRVDLSHRWSPSRTPENALFGWYRIRLRLSANDDVSRARLEQLGVQLGQVMNAYELYVGGQLVGGVGRLPPSTHTAVDYDRKRIFPVPPSAVSPEGELVLALRVWGGSQALAEHWGVGPYNGVFKLGSYDQLLGNLVISEMPGLMLGVICVVFGMYHLYLYWRNHYLKSFLWFGLLSFAVGVYSLMLNEWRITLGWDFLSYKKLEFGAIYMVPPLSLQLVWTLLDEKIGWRLRLYQAAFLVAGIVLLAVPGLEIHLETLLAWQLALLPALGLTGWLIVSRASQGNREASTVLVGALLFIAASSYDIVLDLRTEGSGSLLPVGFFAFLVSMAISLANRFTDTLVRLEERVAERTDELEAANRRLTEVARVDPLTGLLNRRGFLDEVEVEIQRVFRTRRNFAVIVADIDHFKSINDRYGHACGDHVLAWVASSLHEEVRDIDQVARWGGEEFVFLLPETSAAGAAVLADKLRDRLAGSEIEYGGQRFAITVTFGVSEFQRGESLDSCIARADAALYRGKDQGRDRVVVGDTAAAGCTP